MGHELWRGGEKAGYIYENHVVTHDGKKLGYFSGEFVYDIGGHKLAHIDGNHLYSYGRGDEEKIDLEKINEVIVGGTYPQIVKCAIYVLLGS